MAFASIRPIQLFFACILSFALLSVSAQAQVDPLEAAKVRRSIADQRADSQVKEAIQEAEKVAKASPTTAVKALKQTRLELDISADISSDKRKELVSKLDAKIAVLEGRAPLPTVDPKIAKQKELIAKTLAASQLEAKEVHEGVIEIQKAQDSNNPTKAMSKIAELSRKYPNNPSVILLQGQGTMAERVIEARLLAKEQNERIIYAMNDVARSNLPLKGDLEYPKNWKEISERRLQPYKLSAEEEAILEALEKPVKQGFNGQPFEESLQNLSNLINQPIYIDKKSLEDSGRDLRTPVNMPGNVTARTALRALLQAQGLTFIIKDKVIQVVTTEKAQASLVTRVYYLGDLTVATGPFGGAPMWGPLVDAQQTMKNADVIIESIKTSVDPLVWKEKQGPATITFHFPSMIIVRAPAEVHSSLSGKLRR
jgi:hypothetical protein